MGTLLSISENQDLVNKKDRETSINFVSYYVYFYSDLSLDFQSNIFREFCQLKTDEQRRLFLLNSRFILVSATAWPLRPRLLSDFVLVSATA